MTRMQDITRRSFFTAGIAAPAAIGGMLLPSPAKASLGSGRYLDSRSIGDGYRIDGSDADHLLLFDQPGGGDVWLDDAFPIGSGFGVMKDEDGAGTVHVRGDTLGIGGYDQVVFHIRNMGGDFYRVDTGWRYLPFGSEVAPDATLHRTVVAPQPGDVDFIEPTTNQSKIIRYNCQARSLLAILPDPAGGRWGLAAQYRSAMKVDIQRVDSAPWHTLTVMVQGGTLINRQLRLMMPIDSGVSLYSDGNAWRIRASHGL